MRIRFTNEKAFSAKLKEFARRSQTAPGIIAESIANEAFRNVVERTPRRTGWAQASWNMSEGTIDNSVPPKPAKGAQLPTPTPPQLPTPPEFPVYYITNALIYITELEAGRSIQMDKGYMVQRTLAQLQADIDLILREEDV